MLALYDQLFAQTPTPIVALNRRLGAMPLVGGNGATLLTDYEESIAAMTEAIEGARDYANIEFYILAWDEATEAFWQAVTDATGRSALGFRFHPDAYKALRQHPAVAGLQVETRRLELKNDRKWGPKRG